MQLEGRIDIVLTRRGTRIENVDIRSSRPVRISALFEGMPVEKALSQIEIIFGICAKAQGYAAVTACEQALGRNPPSDVDAARKMIVAAETAREHLLRIATNWADLVNARLDTKSMIWIVSFPGLIQHGLFGEAPPYRPSPVLAPDIVAIRRHIDDFDTVLEEHLLGEPPDSWLQRRNLEDLSEWMEKSSTISARLFSHVLKKGWQDAGRHRISFLPELPAEDLAEKLFQDHTFEFIARPHWHNQPCETNVLSRQAGTPLITDLTSQTGTGLLTRLAARLVELAILPGLMRQTLERIEADHGGNSISINTESDNASSIPVSGRGLAQVEAARGRLVHGVEIHEGRIGKYRILAPTEWNFHPEGTVKQALTGLQAGSEAELKRVADLLVSSIDPCVNYDLRMD